VIFAEILNSLERDTDDARAALKQLAGLSGGAFADLPADRRTEIATALKTEGGAALFALNRVVLLCYYRDDRSLSVIAGNELIVKHIKEIIAPDRD